MKTTPARNKNQPHSLRNRIQQLRQRLATFNADALLITTPNDTRYLTGFSGEDSWTLIRRTTNKPTILSDFRFHEQITREAPAAAVIIRKRSLPDALKQLLQRTHAKRLAIQSAHTTLAQRKALAAALGARNLVPVDDGLLQQRAIKDPAEVAAIRKALRIQQQAFTNTLATIAPGQTEQQIAAQLEYQMRLLGADGPSFPTIVAVDANASLPHAVPGRKKVRANSTLLIDWGARYNGYCSDLSRVIALRRFTPRIKHIYQIVRDAQLAAIDAIAPGVPLAHIDAAARTVIDRAGFAKNFGHALGHGIGLDIHEQPVLSERSTATLLPGHVVTVEPGIYLPGTGGVRIEDDVLVTQTGKRVLSGLPTDLESAII